MKTKGEIGRTGEEKACEYLVKNNYIIMERNFRCRTGEIDIIAQRGDCIHFIEVKTRSGTGYGFPAEAVTAEKQRKIILSVKYFLACNRQYRCLKYKMDVIEVLAKNGKHYIHHIESAFGEGEN